MKDCLLLAALSALLFFILTLCSSANDRQKAAAALALASCEPARPAGASEPRSSEPLTYKEAYNLAMRTGKPLVIWIGTAACPDCISATGEEFVNWTAAKDPRFPSDSLTVGIRRGSEMKMAAQLQEWDGNHLPTIRRALRLWDSRQAQGQSSTITDADLWPGWSNQPANYYAPAMRHFAPQMSGLQSFGGFSGGC